MLQERGELRSPRFWKMAELKLGGNVIRTVVPAKDPAVLPARFVECPVRCGCPKGICYPIPVPPGRWRNATFGPWRMLRAVTLQEADGSGWSIGTGCAETLNGKDCGGMTYYAAACMERHDPDIN